VRAELHRPRDNVVHVLNVDVKESGGAGKVVGRRFGPLFRGLLLDNEDRITDLDLGMGDRAVRVGIAHPLGRSKHLGIKLHSLVAALNNQARRDPAI
jgi:hypothetical protein